MISSSTPPFFNVPFANAAASANITYPIPAASQAGIGKASLADGFPPKNFLPDAAGGIAPFGQDMNGILKEVTENIRWLQAGGIAKYNSGFSTAITGYPNGAVLLNAASTGFWVSLVDNNTSNPDAGGANWNTMSSAYLDKSVAGSGNVTLTSAEASYDIIDFVGALTGNIVVTFPQQASKWILKNSTSGAFSLTVAMATGAQIVLKQGTSTSIFSDAINLEYSAQTCATAAPGDNSLLIANTAFVNSVLTGKNAYADVALTGTGVYNLSTVEANHFIINLTGNLSGVMLVLVPAATANQWIFRNSTAGGFAVTVNISGGGAPIPLPALENTLIISNGAGVFYGSETAATAALGDSSLLVANTAFVHAAVAGVNTYIDIPIPNGATTYSLLPAQKANLIIDFSPVIANPLTANVLITIPVSGTPAGAQQWTFRNSYSPSNFSMTIQTDKPLTRQITLMSGTDTILITDGNNLSYAAESVDTFYDLTVLPSDSTKRIANTQFVQAAITKVNSYIDIIIQTGQTGYTLTASDMAHLIIDFVPQTGVFATANLLIIIPIGGVVTDARQWTFRNSFGLSAYSVQIRTNSASPTNRTITLYPGTDTILITDGTNLSYATEAVDTFYYANSQGGSANSSLLIANTAFVQAAVTGAAAGVASLAGGSTGLTPATATTGPITLGGVLAIANGGSGSTTATGTGANVLQASPDLSGIPTAPTAAVGSVNRQLATTAFSAGTLVKGLPSTQMYQIFPSGLVMQWGTATSAANGLANVIFPYAGMTHIVNSTACATVSTAESCCIGLTGFTPADATFFTTDSATGAGASFVFHWSVIGYI